MIQLINVSMQFGDKIVLKNQNCSLNKGINLIIGENGSGKSTLMKIMMGILSPTSGEVLYRSNDMKFSYQGQDESLYDNESLNKNIKLLKADIDEKIFNELCNILTFSDTNKKISSLSGGERQKAEIIFCLSKKASVYFLDEHFSSLDKKTKGKLVTYLNEFSEERYVVLINHDKSLSSLHIDKIIELFSEDHKEVNSYSVSKIIKNNRVFLAFSSYFKNQKILSLIKFMLLVSSFLLFSLGMSYVNTKTDYERYSNLLSQDPFSVHSINFSNVKSIEEVDPSIFSFTKEDGYQYLKLYETSSERAITFYGAKEESTTLDYYTNKKTKAFPNDSFLVLNDETYMINFIEKDELQSKVNKSKHIQSVIDGYKEDDILLCSNDFIDKILTSNLNEIKGSPNISFNTSYGFSFDEYNGCLKRGTTSLKSNIVENRDDYYLSIPNCSPNKVIKTFEFNTEIKVNESSSDSKIHISLPLLKLLYSQYDASFNRSEVAYGLDLNDSYIENLIKSCSSITPLEINKDFSRINSKYLYLYFPLSTILFLSDIFVILFTKNRYSKWYQKQVNIFDRNQLSKKSFDLGLLLANSFEALLAGTISLTLYIFLFIPKANYNLMIEGILIHPENFYYYSEQPNNPYYDNITSPMRLITFEPLFFIIILFILTYLAINIYATKSSKNQVA